MCLDVLLLKTRDFRMQMLLVHILTRVFSPNEWAITLRVSGRRQALPSPKNTMIRP